MSHGFRDKAVYPVIYMFCITLFCTSILLGVSHATKARVEANREVAFEKAVLESVGRNMEGEGAARIHEIFQQEISPPDAGSGKAYRHMDGEKLMALALPFEGRGFWDTIRGVIGIQPDGRTLTGISFHQQNETPGLGAEITKPAFRQQFAGVRLQTGEKRIELTPQGSDSDQGEVDAITGATQTCMRLESLLNKALKEWQGDLKAKGETR